MLLFFAESNPKAAIIEIKIKKGKRKDGEEWYLYQFMAATNYFCSPKHNWPINFSEKKMRERTGAWSYIWITS